MADTTDNTVNESQGYSYITYSGTLDFTGNLEDTHKSQAFHISEANNALAGYYSKASGGGGTNGDIQVSLEVSNDRENWISVSTLIADHDAVADQDALLGDTNYEQFKAYRWGRISADGQASNDYTTIDWSVTLTKNDGVATKTNSSVLGADVKDAI